MIEFVLAVIFVLWLLGFIQADFLSNVLTNINGIDISIKEVLLFLLILWLIGLLQRPFREIVSVLFVLWILSTLGIIAIAGISNFLVLAVVLGAVVYIIKR
jgi:hypothetical protein